MQGERLFVVSPHLDDAVFGCGALLAQHPGSTVCTIFAGKPSPAMQTPWDREAGFDDSDAAMESRYAEDRTALERCDATPLHLDFLDSQYQNSPTHEAISEALQRIWSDYRDYAFVMPMGLWHSDHVLAADGCLHAASRMGADNVLMYEEALYRASPDAVAARLATLTAEKINLEAVGFSDRQLPPPSDALACKWYAVSAYASQLQALHDNRPADIDKPEGYWRVSFPNSTVRL